MCASEYFYELTRIGTGNSTAHYGIGVSEATRLAREQSQLDLRHRLVFESELVPCPKCNWINDDLVEGYRRSRYRNIRSFAVAVGFFGAISSLIGAWYISIGPVADRVALPFFLFGGPLASLMSAYGLVLFRNWMRSRIRPNREFPMEPKLPPGSPPALLWDESCGALVVGKAGYSQIRYGNDWHNFQIGRHVLPFLCCDCLQNASSDQAYECPITETIKLEIPRCEDCARNANRGFRRIVWISTAFGILVSALAIKLEFNSSEFWIVTCCSWIVSLALASFLASVMTAPVKLASADRSRGVVRLKFRNPEYGRIVAEYLCASGEAI